MPEILSIRNLTKRYTTEKKQNKAAKPPAVDNLSLTVRPGDIYGFIGHNGAGKTTTLRAIAGILDFEEGAILIDGFDVKDQPLECKARLAFLPDNPDLYDFLTGVQFLNFVADIHRVPPDLRTRRVRELGDLLELTAALGDLISSYSHGMKQKLALISALLHSPKLLVLDEPFVGLDPQASFRLKEAMRQLCDQGSAIFFSTHVLEVAEKLCNRIAIIKQGRLVADGPIDEVRGDTSLEQVFLEVVHHGDA